MTHPVGQLDVDVVIGADGRRNTLPGKEPIKTNENDQINNQAKR
jgi:hypothetical protein